ncbi:MAG: universal stress protein [Nitrosopumilus sp.]|nr:universal stress protein [Nitrosopumilus sp.]
MLKIQMKKILVPLDGSDNSFRGLENAIYLARQCGAILTGIFVVPIQTRETIKKIGIFKKIIPEEINKVMDSAKTKAAENGIVFKYNIVGGDVKEGIVEFDDDKKNGIDLIIMGSRGAGDAASYFGSVAKTIMQKASIPVLIVK